MLAVNVDMYAQRMFAVIVVQHVNQREDAILYVVDAGDKVEVGVAFTVTQFANQNFGTILADLQRRHSRLEHVDVVDIKVALQSFQ